MEVFMKTIRKYASMAFLLISAVTIVPAFANPTINEQEEVTREEITIESQQPETIWYKRTDLRNKIGSVLVLGGFVALYLFMIKQEEYRFSKENLEKYGIKPTKK